MRVFAVLAALFLGAAGGSAQDLPPTVEVQQSEPSVPTILTIDMERVFVVSAFGNRISTEYNSGRSALANENRRIAAALREEELALAEQRSEMEADVFRAEAEAFDEKAQAIRRAQDAKERDLEAGLSNGREQFLEVTRPILGQMMVERGAFAILDRRSVLLSLGSIDITELAIVRINDTIGDGRDLSGAGGQD